ncbi:hypothetical protein [Marinobacter subterrani]|uniref:Uncharacterized protein n=1 Tax=Marinobacter subterrani TaxID=1658765 RepID=A0A0J7JAU6_9GAMM|nr:hypothetical protein [Marinobacter subterrani]KMQ75297.1 hypothetical protein Msub_11499 [Marinobacter subterrani]
MATAKKKALVLVDYHPLGLNCGDYVELPEGQLKELEAEGIVDTNAPAPKAPEKTKDDGEPIE